MGQAPTSLTEAADALLADTLVLDAVWLSRAFVQVLEHAPTRKAGGMLDHKSFGKRSGPSMSARSGMSTRRVNMTVSLG